VAVIGITDYAQKALGDITYVELPQMGTKLQQGKEFAVVESAKAASDVFAPVSGAVAEVNSSLADHPELINQDPYGEGWLVRLTGVSAAEVASLLSPQEYEKLIATEEGG
jgi:glycine cleavage system H protein